MSLKKVKRNFAIDKRLVLLLVLLSITSLVAIYLASPLSSESGLVGKQIQWMILSYIFLVVLMMFGKNNLYDINRIIYWILMIMLLLLIVDKYIDLPFIRPVNGTRAWFQFPGIGSFQPSEFMKWSILMIVADVIDRHNKQKEDQSYMSDIMLFIKVGIYVLPPVILMLFQPDTGIPLIIFSGVALMLIFSGINKGWIVFGFASLFVVVGGVLFLFKTNPTLLSEILGSPYKLGRFYGWLETEKYYLSYGDQLYRALLAVGSAGFMGHGLGEALVYFAEPQNDFIFAVIGQNFGFIGGVVVIILCAALDYKLIRIALKYEYLKEKYLMAGIIGIILFQQIENMGMIVGLLPITGITLPFISYGGSSFMSYMIPLSIVFAMSSQNIMDGK